MACSPEQVSETLTVQRIAQILACHDDPDCSDLAYASPDRWLSAIDEAIAAGKLKPVEGGDDRHKFRGLVKDERQLRRKDVLEWLQEKDIADANIPDSFWPVGAMPERQPGEGEEDILALEAFGLLVEAFAHKLSREHEGRYWHQDRPNISSIVGDMRDTVPDDVTKMGDRKLKGHVSEALKVWEAKKRR